MVYLLNTDFLYSDNVFEYRLSQVSECRRKKVERLQLRKSKNLCLGAGLLINEGLSLFGLSEKDALLSFGENGKPYFSSHRNIFFNISHSGNMAACVFSDKEIGLDIEKVDVPDFKVAEKYFTENEKKYIQHHPSPVLRNQAFYKIWTLKESFVKATGKGLSVPFYDFEITVDKNISISQTFTDKKYYFKVFEIDGLIVSVCSENKACGNVTVINADSLSPPPKRDFETGY